jgi:FAD/FMN-containing dehydrogenase
VVESQTESPLPSRHQKKGEKTVPTPSSLASAIAQRHETFIGALLQPDHPTYEHARKIHNGLIDKRPALIATCRGTADIADAIKLARETGLEIAVRGGGHNVAGRCTVDSGLMIDLSAMTAIHVDPRNKTARAQGGATWNHFNRETQLHGLATTGGVVSSTGIAGLTLGGGLGWLMGKHALALDNLLSVELVQADGKILTASEAEHPDLFWALRGGGGNFGVAASLEYRLHEIGPIVTGGLIAYPFAQAYDTLRYFRDITASLPDELMVFGGLVHAPDGSGTKLVAMVLCHCGPPEAGGRLVQPVRNFGSPVMDAVGPIPYSQMNAMLDAGYPKGALNYWKSNFLSSLSDDALRTMIDAFARAPSPMSQILIEHFHGEVCRIAPDATAFPHRAPGYNFLVLSQWTDPGQNDASIQWARDSYAAMQPFLGETRYVNYLGDDEPDAAVAAAYGPNYRRLQQVKTQYDPENTFHRNQNIRPLL